MRTATAAKKRITAARWIPVWSVLDFCRPIGQNSESVEMRGNALWFPFLRGFSSMHAFQVLSFRFQALMLTGFLIANQPSCGFTKEPAGTDLSEVSPIQVSEADWPWWRGPQHNGIAPSGQNPPLTWSNSSNIVWKLAVPGRGHGSPIVVGDQVIITCADTDRKVQSVLCVDRKSGRQIWETVVHKEGLDIRQNDKSSMASASAACDGERIFVNFLNADSVFMTALDRSGNIVWQQKLSGYVNHQGFGSSPLLYGSLVIGVSDNKGGGAIVAMDRKSGNIEWRKERPAKPNYPSPVIFHVGGRDQMFLTGCDLVTSLNPLNGDVLWEIEGATTECVTTTVTDGTHIFTSGGYPKNHVSAVVATGKPALAWEHPSRTYVPSLLCRDNRLLAVMDAGIAVCWNSQTGKELWKGRLEGTFSSSPVLVNDLIYVTNEAGVTFVFRFSVDQLDIVGTNSLGDSVFATPAICGSRIYNRIGVTANGKRQEFLVCLGESQE